MEERSLVVIKSDGVVRGLAGKIISRFEEVGLKLVGVKLLNVPRSLAEKHYPLDREAWLRGMGEKTLENYKKFNVDPIKMLGTNDTHEIFEQFRKFKEDLNEQESTPTGPALA